MLHVHFFIRGAIVTDITRNRSTLILNPVLPMHTSPSLSLPFLRNYFPRDEVDRIQITLASMFIAFVLYYSSLYHCRPFGSLRSGFYLFFAWSRPLSTVPRFSWFFFFFFRTLLHIPRCHCLQPSSHLPTCNRTVLYNTSCNSSGL